MFWITRSFVLTRSAARLTGSISASAAFHARSYSSLRQREMLRPCHLFSDRKSTRLNSSHLVISYAVFCLKKKKKIHDCGVQLGEWHTEWIACRSVIRRECVHELVH